MIYTCCDENRRALVDAHPTLNGIDWLEVLDKDAPVDSPRQRTLLVRLLKPVPLGLTPGNVLITGGERIRDVRVEWIGIANAPPAEATPAEQTLFTALAKPDHVLLVRTDSSGDHSVYRLHLTLSGEPESPLADFDPRLSAIDFSFKVECPSDFDCKPAKCAESPPAIVDQSYLARDYESLRRLVVDRLSRRMPGWRDRSPADFATVLAELIAYVGDLQHYELDAISTEAYLHTARRRTSVRRHALLVDYRMHEGSNARVWLHLRVSGAPFVLPDGLRFLTRVPGAEPRIVPDSAQEREALAAKPAIFEVVGGSALQPVELRSAHNELPFYTWGDARCCLPAGATRATLRGHFPDLAPGDVLILQEQLGPLTGREEDADPAHRHAVRLSSVRAFAGAAPLTDPLDGTEITEITWHNGDALPFPLCLSSETDEAHGSAQVADVSIALGNVVLADHGQTILDEVLASVPSPRLQFPPVAHDSCDRQAPEPLAPRYRPSLAEHPVTHQGTVGVNLIENGVRRSERRLIDTSASAAAAFALLASDAVPALTLESSDGTLVEHWIPRRDLLSSRGGDTHFAVEIEDDGRARLRFGDDVHGKRPNTGATFQATYRVGNGTAGNVGADSIAHVVADDARIEAVSNPLAARGGLEAESATEVRRRAPQAFRTLERAVTPADTERMTERMSGVQRAAASLRWTGSWHTVFVAVDRSGGERVDELFAQEVVEHLDRYRMAGHDLHVEEPIHVALEIELLVCVAPGYFREDVRRGLLDVLSNRVRSDGTKGLFHADAFTFGQTVFLSPVYAAARTVPGVESVEVKKFVRQGDDDWKPLDDGFLQLGRLEIARLDNDPNFPEHGVLRLELHGGK